METNNFHRLVRRWLRPTLSLTVSAWFLLLGFLLTGSVSQGQGRQSGPRGGGGGGMPVTIGTVTQRSVPVQVRAIGTVEASSTVAVRAQVTGELVQVHFDEGQDVKKGDLLFTIDPRLFEASIKQYEANLSKTTAQVGQAEAALARDAAQLKNAEVQAQRYANLLEGGLVSKDQYEQIRTTADSLAQVVKADEAAVESARQAIGVDRAAIDNAKLQLNYASIFSPIDGRTGSLMVNQGNLVRANDTAPLVVINRLTPIYVSFAVTDKQLPEVKKYMALGKLKVDGSIPSVEGPLEKGTVTFVDNAVDNSTGTIRLKASFPNEDRRLWPGQFVNVVLTLSTQSDAVVVPSESVQTGQKGQYVFIVKPDQTVEMRPVTVARTIENDTIVSSGVKPGETVVTDGQLRLVPGSKVKVRGPEKENP